MWQALGSALRRIIDKRDRAASTLPEVLGCLGRWMNKQTTQCRVSAKIRSIEDARGATNLNSRN